MSSPANQPLPADACPTDEIGPHDSQEAILKNRDKCMAVFYALLVFTVLTVAVAQIPFGMWGHIGVALLIAIIKAALVILFFMHFLHEKITIYQFMALTTIFAFVLFGLTWLAWWDPILLPFNIYGGETPPPAGH